MHTLESEFYGKPGFSNGSGEEFVSEPFSATKRLDTPHLSHFPVGGAPSLRAKENTVQAEKQAPSVVMYDSDHMPTADQEKNLPRSAQNLIDGAFHLRSVAASQNPDAHPGIEAKGMSEFSVLAIRVEAKNGNSQDYLDALGSIGIAAYSARINGQIVIISFDPKFRDSLRDPDAVAMYEALEAKLHTTLKNSHGAITVSYGEDEATFMKRVEAAVVEQRDKETARKVMTPGDIERFDQERAEKMKKPQRFVVVGGSSASFSKNKNSLVSRGFETEQSLIEQALSPQDNVVVLNKEPIAQFFTDAYAETNPSQRMKKFGVGFAIEEGLTQRAESVVWIIQNRAISKAAVVQTGFLLDQMLENKNQLSLLFEPFNSDLYLRTVFGEKINDVRQQVGQDAQANALLDRLAQDPNSVSVKDIEAVPALVATEYFRKFRMDCLTRQTFEKQIEVLQDKVEALMGHQGIELFTFSSDATQFVQKLKLSSSAEAFAGHEQYYDNFLKYKARLKELVEQNKGQKDKAVELIYEAMETINPRATRRKELDMHLLSVGQDAHRLGDILKQHPPAPGKEAFLPAEHLDLIAQYVGPLHDVMKFLGSPDMQANDSHEILMGYIINEFFPALGFTPEETSIIAQVIIEHENIFREDKWHDLAKSEDPIQRDKAFFFLNDVMTGAIQVDEQGNITFDPALLQERYGDVYYRHIDLVEGKVFRPEWGVNSVKEILVTLETIAAAHNLTLSDAERLKLIQCAQRTTEAAIEANKQRPEPTEPQPKPIKFTTQQIIRVAAATNEIKKLKTGEMKNIEATQTAQVVAAGEAAQEAGK
jgi:hypothetical protein